MQLFKSMIIQSFLLFILSLTVSIYSHALSPKLLEQLKKENIVDTTRTLSDTEIKNLKQQNEQMYQQQKIDFKILMIPTIQNTSIEQYSENVFNSIKIGNEKLDNGLLLVIAKDDRKMRFEVGYGLEGDFTDIQAGRVIRNTLAPNFKNSEYYQGLYQTQSLLLAKNITLIAPTAEPEALTFSLKTIGAILLSIVLCIPLYWLYTKATVKWGTSASMGVFIAILVFQIFIQLLIIGYLYSAKIAYFLCALIPLYAPILIAVFLPKDQTHKLLKIILYSLPPQIFSVFGFGIFYYVDFFPDTSVLILKCLVVILILIFLRYLQFLYRFKKHTEHAYLTSFYNEYLREKERKQAIFDEYDRLDAEKKSNSSNQSSSSSSSHSSSSSISSSSSSSSTSSSNDRDSGGSSGGGGASGGW